jgi:hypothetical protein
VPIFNVVAVMSGEDLPYNRTTSSQSSLSQSIADILNTDGGIVHSWCNSAVVVASCTCPAGVMFECTDSVRVLLHVACHSEDDRMSVLSPCSAVLGVSQYGHCNLLPWPHLQSSCLLEACSRHVQADEQGPWASFFWCFSESVERTL